MIKAGEEEKELKSFNEPSKLLSDRNLVKINFIDENLKEVFPVFFLI